MHLKGNAARVSAPIPSPKSKNKHKALDLKKHRRTSSIVCYFGLFFGSFIVVENHSKSLIFISLKMRHFCLFSNTVRKLSTKNDVKEGLDDNDHANIN